MATEAELSRRIDQAKAGLAHLGDLRPGALSEQYNTCRSPNCRCKANPPARHGPYHQLSYSRNGKSTTENVSTEDLDSVRAQIANYQELRRLVDDWVDASIELDRMRRAARRKNRVSAGK